MTFSYVWEKTYAAARALAANHAPTLAERLEDAYLDGLMRLERERDWGSDENREAWEALRDAVLGPSGETIELQAALAGMSESDQLQLADQIMDLYAVIEQEHGRRQTQGTEFD